VAFSNKETIRIGVGAVVFKDDQVLLIKRGKPPFKGHWSIPGGKLDYGERLEDGLAREVREETGVEIAIKGLIGVFEAMPTMPGQTGHMVLIDYLAVWVSGEAHADDDAAAAAFMSIEEAQRRLSWDETRKALGMALEMRAL
jgi:8-oxo-dGTP diphosphatase